MRRFITSLAALACVFLLSNAAQAQHGGHGHGGHGGHGHFGHGHFGHHRFFYRHRPAYWAAPIWYPAYSRWAYWDSVLARYFYWSEEDQCYYPI